MKHLPIYIIICLLSFRSIGQITVFYDDFSSNGNTSWTTSGPIGSSSWSVSRSGVDWGARINSSPAQLELTNDASTSGNVNGWVFVYTQTSNFSAPYNPTLSSNIDKVTWFFNLRQIRTDPAGFGSGSYGVALILATNSINTFNNGSGYAIVLGQSGTTDPIRLAKFNNGLGGTLSNIIVSNTTGLTDIGNEYISGKVTYDPSTNTWELFLRNDGTSSFTDPTEGQLTSQGTATDNTYAGSALPYIGAYWQGSTSANQTAFFDNIVIQVSGYKESTNGGGLWNNSSTWDPQGTPVKWDGVKIKTGHTVAVDDERSCQNLEIETSAVLNINSGKKLTVSGTLSNSGTLTLKSDATGTGSLIHSTSEVSATVERYVAGNWATAEDGWHLISSPVVSQAISAFETTGAGNGYDFFGWNEASKLWMNYKDAGFSTWNGSSNFVLGRGYLISYEQNQTGKYFSGELNISSVTLNDLSYTPSQGNGWHLLGNPFASAIKWNDGNWSLTDVATTAKIWHSTNKSYTDIAANGIIPQAQGFFIRVTNSTNSITIPAAARVHNSTAWYKNSDVPQLTLIARPADGSSAQETHIRLEPQATHNNDPYWDSHFMAGYAPQLYSLAEGVKLSTNALPSLSEDMEIPLGFQKNQHNNFTLELSDNTLAAIVILKDLKTGITHNLSQQPVYSFTSSEGDDPLRFKLAFASVGIESAGTESVPYAWYAGGNIHFRNVEQGTWVEVYASNGQLMKREQYRGEAMHWQVAPGVYFVKILKAKQQNVQKIVIY